MPNPTISDLLYTNGCLVESSDLGLTTQVGPSARSAMITAMTTGAYFPFVSERVLEVGLTEEYIDFNVSDTPVLNDAAFFGYQLTLKPALPDDQLVGESFKVTCYTGIEGEDGNEIHSYEIRVTSASDVITFASLCWGRVPEVACLAGTFLWDGVPDHNPPQNGLVITYDDLLYESFTARPLQLGDFYTTTLLRKFYGKGDSDATYIR